MGILFVAFGLFLSLQQEPPIIEGDKLWLERWQAALMEFDNDERWFISVTLREIHSGLAVDGLTYCSVNTNGIVHCGPDPLYGLSERSLYDASILMHEATHIAEFRRDSKAFFLECPALKNQASFLMKHARSYLGLLFASVIQLQAKVECAE